MARTLSHGAYLVEAMKIMFQNGLINPRGGNGSVRISEYEILITPSGLPKYMLTPNDLVKYNIVDKTYVGAYRPSIEVHTHAKIYSIRDEAKAVLHAHPPLTIALVDQGLKEWWRTDLVEAEFSVEQVCIAKPAPPGTPELASNVGECVKEGGKVIVIPKHGVFAWGSTVWEALDAIIALEYTAKYYLVSKLLKIIK
ncbi:MAG: aldolase [Desulfurococcales archaeon ex4484_58]|nr:MAG: aldolase [Desulfurococcales archaeon ex4484_58]